MNRAQFQTLRAIRILLGIPTYYMHKVKLPLPAPTPQPPDPPPPPPKKNVTLPTPVYILLMVPTYHKSLVNLRK